MLGDQTVDLAGDLPVRADAVTPATDDGEDRRRLLGFEFIRDCEPFEEAVDSAVFRVNDSCLRDE